MANETAPVPPTLKEGKDIDGDSILFAVVDDLTIFATEQIGGSWSLSFGLTAELDGGDWMETLTGRGAFSTIRAIRPAVEALIAEIERRGREWSVCCDQRRAKLYARYIPAERIKIID